MHYTRLFHADWSVDKRKRWIASAARKGGRWCLDAPTRVIDTSRLVEELLAFGRSEGVLAGFDFPIGVPLGYGELTGLRDFKTLLAEAGSGPWLNFFDVANRPGDISLQRPFYPRTSFKGSRRDDLTSGLGFTAFADLFRACELRTETGRQACALFWTLGGNQVGRAAISGWQEVIRPAIEQGAKLWPFDGSLEHLSDEAGLVIAETYPADAYRMYGAAFTPRESKRNKLHRASKANAIIGWADRREVHLSNELNMLIHDGFGASSTGEDAYDAFAGLIKMIEIVDRRHNEASRTVALSAQWEGWILGR